MRGDVGRTGRRRCESVTIPADPQNPAGLRHLYRLGAASVGRVVVQIPRTSATTDASAAPFMVTLDIH